MIIKLHRLISQKPFKQNDYNVPVVNVSSEELDVENLRYGLHHSYANKNKYIKRDIAVEFEILTAILDPFLNQSAKETFHEYLRSSTKVIANNVYQDSDNIFKSLNNLRNNSNIMILSAGKVCLQYKSRFKAFSKFPVQTFLQDRILRQNVLYL